jgi:hypothetical protein
MWDWLKNVDNRDILKMAAGAFAAIVVAVWAVLTFAVDRHPSVSVTAGAGGMAAGRDISGNNTLTSQPAPPPPAASPNPK